jgi:hypothetical protein
LPCAHGLPEFSSSHNQRTPFCLRLPFLLLRLWNALQKGQKGSVCCVCAKRTHNIHYATDLFAVESLYHGWQKRTIGHEPDARLLAQTRDGVYPTKRQAQA